MKNQLVAVESHLIFKYFGKKSILSCFNITTNIVNYI